MNQRPFSERLLAPFSRKTSSGRYVPEIDGLRCLAIVLVVLFHQHHLFLGEGELTKSDELIKADGWDGLRYLPNFIFAKGWFGVQIFFVISGMVLALPFAGHHLKGESLPGVRNYFLRRLIRIEVPYLLTLTFIFIWQIFFAGASFLEGLPHYGAGLIYCHMLFFDGALNPVLPVSWTLEIEIQFYLIAPLLCQVYRISSAWIRRGIFVAAIIVIDPLFDWEGLSLFKNTLLPRLGYFLAGMLLADFYLLRKENSPRIGWDVVGLLVWPFVFWLIEVSTVINLKPAALLLAFWTILHGTYLRRIFSFPWFTAIGTMCYTIYLYHEFMIYGVLNHFVFGPIIPVTDGEWPLNSLLMLLMAGCAISMCALVFLMVEKPFARGRLPFRKAEKQK